MLHLCSYETQKLLSILTRSWIKSSYSLTVWPIEEGAIHGNGIKSTRIYSFGDNLQEFFYFDHTEIPIWEATS